MPKLRVVLVGCGGICKAWLSQRAVADEVEIVGLVDLRRASAEAVQAAFKLDGAIIGTELGEVLDRARPEAVFDCTIPGSHPAVTIAALERGCHVLGEKPMCEDMGNARRMVEAARRTQRIYAVIQNRRYDPNIRRLAAFLRSGAIGQVHSVYADFFISAHFGGFRETMEHVLLLDMAVHSFDQARLLCGADAEAVQCTEFNPPGSWYRHGASAVATFEMAGGAVFNYRGSWCATGATTSWECSWRILGSRGAVTWDGAGAMRAEVVTNPAQPSSEQGGGLIRALHEIPIPELDTAAFRYGHDGLIAEFVACVRAGRSPETVCTANLNTMAMIHGAVAAAESRSRVLIAKEPTAAAGATR